MSTQKDHDALFNFLEGQGESLVRANLAKGVYGSSKDLVQEWLRAKDAERSTAAEDRREAREIETLEIAKDANSIALSASRSARRANIIAIIASIIAVIAIISEYIINAPE